ncbi:hypothetical protein J3R30DRAFT_3295045, partial [Lentinula aciculospora]
LETLDNIAHRFTSVVLPGAYLVDIMPMLKYFPAAIAKWKRDAQQDSNIDTDWTSKVWNDQQRTSLCTKLDNDEGANGLSDLEKAFVASSHYFIIFLYAMTLHPEVQQQAQIKLDRIIGRSRNPTFANMTQLPYVRVIVKEVCLTLMFFVSMLMYLYSDFEMATVTKTFFSIILFLFFSFLLIFSYLSIISTYTSAHYILISI